MAKVQGNAPVMVPTLPLAPEAYSKRWMNELIHLLQGFFADVFGKFIAARAGNVVYGGHVNADGTLANAPAGWTSSRLGAGDYRVNYDRMVANPGLVLGTFQSTGMDITKPASINVAASDATGFELTVKNQTGGVDYGVTFMVALPQLSTG